MKLADTTALWEPLGTAMAGAAGVTLNMAASVSSDGCVDAAAALPLPSTN